jgi:hypothetical protein
MDMRSLRETQCRSNDTEAGWPRSLLRAWDNSIGFQFEAAVNCPQPGWSNRHKESKMADRSAFGRAARLATPVWVMLLTAVGGAQAFDESKYPDLKGRWRRAERGDIADALSSSWSLPAASRSRR